MLEARDRAAHLDAGQLEAATLELARRADHRLLICVVEQWAQLGTASSRPTPSALLAQVGALLELGQVDRAWTRLQGVPDDPTCRHDRRRLTIRACVDRGWDERAREELDAARRAGDGDPELAVYEDRLAGWAGSGTTGAADPLAAAEALLRAGAVDEARVGLEALVRARPGERRASDLLWAIEGDFALVGTTLQHVAQRYGGRPTRPVEPTAEVDLFDADAGDDDPTQAMRLVDLRDAHRADDLAEDTQVLRVVRGRHADDAFSEVAEPATDALDEDEDDVIVLVRRRTPRTPTSARTTSTRFASSTFADVGRRRAGDDEVADVEELDATAIEDFEELSGADTLEPDDELSPRSPAPVGVLVAAAVVLGASGLGLVFALLWVAQH